MHRAAAAIDPVSLIPCSKSALPGPSNVSGATVIRNLMACFFFKSAEPFTHQGLLELGHLSRRHYCRVFSNRQGHRVSNYATSWLSRKPTGSPIPASSARLGLIGLVQSLNRILEILRHRLPL